MLIVESNGKKYLFKEDDIDNDSYWLHPIDSTGLSNLTMKYFCDYSDERLAHIAKCKTKRISDNEEEIIVNQLQSQKVNLANQNSFFKK